MSLVVTVIGTGDIIEADAVTDLNYDLAAEASVYPLEDGTEGADHTSLRPREVSMQAHFSAENDRRLKPTGIVRVRAAVLKLEQIILLRSPVRVVVDGRIYDPALLLALGDRRAGLDGDGRSLNLRFMEIRVARTKTVKVYSTSVKHRGKRKKLGTGFLTLAGKALGATAAASVGGWRAALDIARL